MIKPKLILLSDLWGRLHDDWTAMYLKNIEPYYEIEYFDCRHLAEIDLELRSEQAIYSAFKSTGINVAVANLQGLITSHVSILGFSIGGAIAWKLACESPYVDQLICVSSTGIRREKIKPNTTINLLFSDSDPNLPSTAWFQHMSIPTKLLKGGGHTLYRSKNVMHEVLSSMKYFIR